MSFVTPQSIYRHLEEVNLKLYLIVTVGLIKQPLCPRNLIEFTFILPV